MLCLIEVVVLVRLVGVEPVRTSVTRECTSLPGDWWDYMPSEGRCRSNHH